MLYLMDINPGLLVIVFAMVLGMIASGAVRGAYRKWSRVPNSRGMSGAQMARAILDGYGLAQVDVEMTGGTLSDHYDPRSSTLRLSRDVYGGNSVAAIGIAAHEAGHAVQHAMGYSPLKVRNALVPVANLGSQLLFPLLVGGFFFRMTNLIYIGAAIYFVALMFHLFTLPVEFNASARAVAWLEKAHGFPPDEVGGVRSVLRAASLTYVASALAALGQLVWLLMAGRRR
jgi:Zn-dependent membrane protease YugP